MEGTKRAINDFTWNDFEQPKVASLTQIKKMRLAILGNIDDDRQDTLFESLLEDAKNIYLDLVYPFNRELLELPSTRARNWQTRCAIELYNLKDDQNLLEYSENGLTEKYGVAGLSKNLLSDLPPAHGGVPIDG